MNAGLRNNRTSSPRQFLNNSNGNLAITKIYFKDGRVKTLPFRSLARSSCTSCSQHPEHQLMRWFKNQAAAQPGFPTSIKNILFLNNDAPCDNCKQQLSAFLGKYRLADRLRLVNNTPKQASTCSCGCSGKHESQRKTVQFSTPNSYTVLDVILGEMEFTKNQKKQNRSKARNQYEEKTSVRASKTGKQIDHGIPLSQAHYDKMVEQNPNKMNLRAVSPKIHAEKEKMWNDYVLQTFYQKCTTAEERRQKLSDIFSVLRKKYPNEDVGRVFGKELEMMELEIY